MRLIFDFRPVVKIFLLFVVSLTGFHVWAAESCHESTFGGVDLICIQKGVASFSAEDRAQAIAERVGRLSKTQTFDPDKLSIIDQEGSSDIMAGDQVIASIRDDDVAPNGQATKHSLAEATALKIQGAIIQDRKNRSPQELLREVIDSALATIGLVVFLVLASKLYRRVYAFIRGGSGRFIPSLKIKSYEVLASQRLSDFLVWLTQLSRFVITLIALYVFIPLVLSFFPATSNLTPKIYGYVVDPLKSMGRVAIEFIPKLFFIVILCFITRYLLRVVRFFFLEIQNETIRFEGFYKEWADPTYKLVRILIIAFAVVIAFPYIPGSSSPAFRGISVFLGVLVSLGSSSAIGNVVAGIVLTYMRPFQIGDRVKIADTVGDVIEKNLLVTKILTIKNVDITIPNSMILASHILNYSTMANNKGLIIHTTVTIGYDSPWKQIHQLLIEAAARTPLIQSDPKPFVLQTSLDDFYVSYQINAFTKVASSMATITSDLHRNIQDSFNAAGVEIMSPHYSSLRDGNEMAVPTENRPADYSSPLFGVEIKSPSSRQGKPTAPVT